MTMSEGNFLDEPEHSVGLDFEVEDGWGWEVEIEDIDIGANDTGNQMINSPGGHKDIRISLKPTVPSKLSGSQESDSSLISRVKSSPSFQELERAIGATLAVGLGEVDPSKKDEQLKLINGVITQKANLKKNIRSFNSLRHRVEAANGEIIPDHIRSPVGRVSGATMKEDLNVYLDIDTESRALILFHSPEITSFDIKTACQLFGSLYYFRSDFHAFGVTLVCYFDIRAAMDAHRSLPARLGRMASVHLSVMLQSTNGLDESRLVVSRVPTTKAESDVQDVFSGYGPLKSIQKSFNNSNSGMGGSIETCDYTVEYYNIQDAKLAISEINSSILNLLNVNSVVSCMHTSRRQEQLRKDVLNVLSQWRARISNAAALNGVPLPPAPKSPPPATDPAVYSEMQTGVSASEESSSADPSGSGASVLSSDSGAIPIPVPTEPPSARVARHVMGLSKSSHQQHHRGSRQSNYYSQHMHQQHPYAQVNGSSMVYSPPGTSMGYAPHGPYSPPGYTPGISSPGRYVSGPQNQSMMPYLPPAYGGYFVPAYMGAPYAVPMGILSPHGSYDNLPYLAQGMPSPHGSYENLQYAMDGEGNWSAHGDGDDGRRGGGRGGQTRPPHHNGGHSAGKRGGRGGRGGRSTSGFGVCSRA